MGSMGQENERPSVELEAGLHTDGKVIWYSLDPWGCKVRHRQSPGREGPEIRLPIAPLDDYPALNWDGVVPVIFRNARVHALWS